MDGGSRVWGEPTVQGTAYADREPYRPRGTRFPARRCPTCRKRRCFPEFDPECGLCAAPRVEPGAIRRARLERGLKQATVAEAVGVHANTYCLWELGRQRVPAHRVGDLSRILGLDAGRA